MLLDVEMGTLWSSSMTKLIWGSGSRPAFQIRQLHVSCLQSSRIVLHTIGSTVTLLFLIELKVLVSAADNVDLPDPGVPAKAMSIRF